MKQPKETSYYTYHNANPKNKKGADCVARAVSFATGKTWENTIKEMTEFAIPLGRVFNEKAAVEKYLEEHGWVKYKQPRQDDNTKYTVQEFCEMQPNGTFIVSVANHLTVVKNGVIHDTWNCGHKSVGNYWG